VKSLKQTLKLLAIDTATEQCSVALRMGDQCVVRCLQTARGHADMILPMVQEVLSEAETTIADLHAIAFGRGPGAFTGVRIGIGVAQGLAYGADLPVIGISNLAAVAQQAVPMMSSSGAILVCMDARINEVYWGLFKHNDNNTDDGLITPVQEEQLSKPEYFTTIKLNPLVCLGTGFRAYPVLQQCFSAVEMNESALPRAQEIAQLAERDYRLGLAVDAMSAQPVYLRDQVTHVKSPV
jgi:tRNA threonylcarbamoyladenosine biosynthesis protein TsaB